MLKRTKCKKPQKKLGQLSMEGVRGWWMEYFSFHRARERDGGREGYKKRKRAISEEIAARCDTVHALTDQSGEDGESEGGQSLQNPSLRGLKRWRGRDGGEGKQKTEISGEG